jgi:hypothetical protein
MYIHQCDAQTLTPIAQVAWSHLSAISHWGQRPTHMKTICVKHIWFAYVWTVEQRCQSPLLHLCFRGWQEITKICNVLHRKSCEQVVVHWRRGWKKGITADGFEKILKKSLMTSADE